MKKASLFASAAVATTIGFGAAGPVFAQAGGPFADVPADHWAYAAVDKLQKAGIVIGYPDGTYGGKRAMTRYEFAVAIARLLDKIPANGGGITQAQLDQALVPYAKKSDLDNLATKADLAGLAKQSDLDALRRLVNEFQTELTALGVDLDATKKRLDALEGRVTAIEQELKRVQIGGEYNMMGRGNNRFDHAGAILDQDGFVVTGPAGSRGGLLADSRVFHDIDLKVKARLSDTATAEAVVNFGNYLPFLGSISSYTGSRTSGRAGIGTGPGAGALTVNQEQSQTVYKAIVEAPIRLPGIGGVDLVVGRLPIQFTPYTLKLIDTDSYFNNSKTDLGDIPVDGGKARFALGPITATTFAAKVDPVKFVSNLDGQFVDQAGYPAYGLYAGSSHSAFAASAGGVRGFQAGNRPRGSSISPGANGAMPIEQMAGVRASLGTSKSGTIGFNYLVAAGRSTGAVTDLGPANDPGNSLTNFDRVFVYGADVNTNLGGIGIIANYSKSDTGGTTTNRDAFGNITSINTKTHEKITKNNDAYDIAGTIGRGNLSLTGGYKQINPYFAAPGYWDKIGAWTNPTDVKGPYVMGKYAFSNQLAFAAEGRFYTGTGKANSTFDAGGLSKDDKIQNLRAGLKFGLTSASNVDLGIERTEYKGPNLIDAGTGSGAKPIEYFYNIGYGYSFTPQTSMKLLYQIIDYRDHNTGFDATDSKGGVAAAQFSVKF